MLKIRIFILIFFSIFTSCSDDCNPELRNRIRLLPIKNLVHIKKLNLVFLRNLELLADSCCQNIGKSCSYPDSVRKSLFYPATKSLLYKYLPKTEMKYLSILEKLSPSKIQNNNDVLISSMDFRSDSTVRYPVFYSNCNDVISKHYLIFHQKNKVFKFNENIKVLKDSIIDPNWTYYIVNYKDEGW